MSLGSGLLVGGFATVFGTFLGFPVFDKAAPCGFLDVTCGAGRFFLFWVFILLGVALIVVGLVALLRSPKEAGAVLMSAGRAGAGFGRRGGGVALRYGRAGGGYLAKRYRERER